MFAVFQVSPHSGWATSHVLLSTLVVYFVTAGGFHGVCQCSDLVRLQLLVAMHRSVAKIGLMFMRYILVVVCEPACPVTQYIRLLSSLAIVC